MQTRINSLIESSLNIGSGFVVALLVWMFLVAPLWGIEVSMLDNLGITGLFTVVSIIRSYLWRRIFNARLGQRYAPVCRTHGCLAKHQGERSCNT